MSGSGPALPAALPPALPASGQLTDGGALALAAAVALGAWWHRPWPMVLVASAVAVAAWVRRPEVLVVAGFLLAGLLGARSFDGLVPVEPGPFRGRVTLVADPQRTPFGMRVDVRVGHRRVELSASDGAAGAVESSLAGEELQVEGRLAAPAPDAPWLVPRHVVGRLSVTSAERVGAGAAPWRAANRFRRLLARGSEVLPDPERALYAGFVLGDDRNQPPEVVDDFRGSGLTHLLVVSGQNVAFTLVLLGPVVGRLAWRGRWCATIAVIAAFGLVTRFEPSVLRASAMAAIAVSAAALGRPTGAVRNLSLGVAGLLLIDPLLVRSVGFQLSVGASLAIGLLAERIATALPGPRILAASLGVTLAAQVGVAPVLVPHFGGLPVVSLVTNVVSVPVAGFVTTWGLPAGVVAGVAGDGVARIAHLPTLVLVRWVATVARLGASVPLGQVGAFHVIALVILGTLLLWSGDRRLRVPVLIAGSIILLLPALGLARPPGLVRFDGGVVLRSDRVTIVAAERGATAAEVLEALRMTGVRRIDVLVVDAARPESMARVLRHRWRIGRVIDARAGPSIRLTIGPYAMVIAPPTPPAITGPGA